MLLLLALACGQGAAAPTLPATPPAGEHGTAHLSAWTRLPAGHTPGAPLGDAPVLVALHGLGDSPDSFLRMVEDLPDDVVLLVPAAPTTWGSGTSWFDIRVGGQTSAAQQAGIGAAIDLAADGVAAWVAVWQAAHGSTAHPVVTGFSQGGMLSFALAADHPDQFAAAVPIGGWLPPDRCPSPRDTWPTIVMFHGEADESVPLAPTLDSVACLQAAGATVQVNTFPGVGHSVPRGMHTEVLAALRAALGTP